MTAPVAPLPDLATLADLKSWPGIVIGDDENDSAQYVLSTASDYVRAHAARGDAVDLWPTADVVPAIAARITVQVAARAWRNPAAYQQSSTGPFSESYAQAVADAVFLTDNEKDLVDTLVTAPRIWTLQVQRDDAFPGAVYDWFSGETIPSSPYPGPPDGFGDWYGPL